MSLFIAYNHATSTGTSVSAGTSYASGAKVAIQLDIPNTIKLRIVEWGISFDGSAAATPATVELVRAATASTMSSNHSSSTILTLGDQGASTTRLGFGTSTDSGYGNGVITSAAADRTIDKQYIAPTSQYVKMWPLGREPIVTDASATFLQLRVNTSATVNAIAYIVWEELTN